MSDQPTVARVDVTVRHVDGHGIQDMDGTRYSISKFARPDDVALPVAGATVRLHLDRANYVRRIEALSATPAPATPSAVDIPAAPPPPIQPRALRDALDPHGKVIVREAALNAATAILSSGGRPVDPRDLLALGERLEAWLTRA
jgi:hypothetical protein